ncbi:MAG: YqeG family HAD IIIA-type phosphatase [Acholeplasmataceae bacterium]|jgi:HAD superfamily phosphatase (TIGR01668 family)|nr:YqeG family HAD IIIA-type phosphatase [Acholeplasmataceae bacterium]
MRVSKYIPNFVYKSVLDIDFLSLYHDKNIRFIFLDIDNTLAPYDVDIPTKETHKLVKELLEIGFELILISNNNKKRVLKFSEPLGLNAIYFALKPLKRGFKKGLKMASKPYKPSEVLVVGDQLMTDISGANNMGFMTILVKPIKRKSDILSTRINRLRERCVLKKLKKHYYEKYEEIRKIL